MSAVDGGAPAVAELGARCQEQRLAHAPVLVVGDAVLAMIAAQLRQERHRLLGVLGREFSEKPAQGIGEGAALVVQIRREQLAHRVVEGEPRRVEAPHELIGASLAVQRGLQHPHRFAVFQAHGLDCRPDRGWGYSE